MSAAPLSPAESFFLQVFALQSADGRVLIEDMSALFDKRDDSIEWWARVGQLLHRPVVEDAIQAGLCDRIEPSELKHVFGIHAAKGDGSVDEAELYMYKYISPAASDRFAAHFEVISLASNGSELKMLRRPRDYGTDAMYEKIAQAPAGCQRAIRNVFRPAFKALGLPYKY